jgi:cysteine desulfurase/selenocysteine lyase
MFNPHSVRDDFPILHQDINGKPLVYLDTAASAHKPRAVIEAMTRFMTTDYANVHRGLYTLANRATTAYEGARATVAAFLGAHTDEIIFTRGATEGLNLIAHGVGAHLKPGDEVVLSIAEHHANLVPWHMLRQRAGVVLRFVPILPDGRLDMDALAAAISPQTRVVAASHMSNVLGVTNDVAAICAMARDAGAISVIDGCQGVVHAPVDVRALGCDIYTFSAHKLYGPTGIGVVYGRAAVLDTLPPFMGGGEMIARVTTDAVDYAAPPLRFEAGTPSIVEAIGLAAAIDYLNGLDRAAVAAHEAALTVHLRTGLADLEAVVIGAAGTGSITSFTLPGCHPHDVAQILDQYGVAVRAGSHCAEPLHTHLQITASARVSFGVYNTMDEVDVCLEAIGKAKRMLA